MKHENKKHSEGEKSRAIIINSHSLSLCLIYRLLEGSLKFVNLNLLIKVSLLRIYKLPTLSMPYRLTLKQLSGFPVKCAAKKCSVYFFHGVFCPFSMAWQVSFDWFFLL